MIRRDTNGRFTGKASSKVKAAEQIANACSELNGLIHNATLTRTNLVRRLLDKRRDLDDECGYPKDITASQYKLLYDREAIATRVVQVWPKESWKVSPSIYEDEDANAVTAFEEAWDTLSQDLRGATKFEGDCGNPIWEYLKRIDELSGVGSFGVLFLGFDDGATDLLQPVQPKEGMKLLFMRAFDESLVDIGAYEQDRSSPRYGLPLKYLVTLNDPNDQLSGSGTGLQLATLEVHWTRVIHVADNLASSEAFGVPRMRPVYNRLYDLMKLYGGSAEMYWQGAFPGIAFEQIPQAADVEVGSDMREAIEKYMNSLQRYIALEGFSAKSLAPQVVDPSAQIDKQIEAICILLGIPKRIFMGSERGELSSGQDDSTWNDRVMERQNNYVTPRIIVPFIDRLINLGVLPEPERYCVDWPDLNTTSEQEKADVGAKQTEAMAKYVGGNVDMLIEPMSYFTMVLGWSEEDAQSAIDATEDYHASVPEPLKPVAPLPGFGEVPEDEEGIDEGLASEEEEV
jgi:hypothetical protein